MAIKGGCLCGKVRYQIAGTLTDADHCHCSMRRRQHGAAFSTQFSSRNMAVARAIQSFKMGTTGCGRLVIPNNYIQWCSDWMSETFAVGGFFWKETTYAGFNLGDFSQIKGEGFVKTYQSLSGGGWCFCSECGSTLAGTCNDNITAITLGTVEGDPGIKPGSHIFIGSKAQWYDVNDGLPQFEERSKKTLNAELNNKKLLY